MDNRIRKMRETTDELGGEKGYFFSFENLDSEPIALAGWTVDPKKGKQSLILTIVNGEPEQLEHLLSVYNEAKEFAERFDLHEITFLFEQYALNENIDIICD